jgi:hypothetical protein
LGSAVLGQSFALPFALDWSKGRESKAKVKRAGLVFNNIIPLLEPLGSLYNYKSYYRRNFIYLIN